MGTAAVVVTPAAAETPAAETPATAAVVELAAAAGAATEAARTAQGDAARAEVSTEILAGQIAELVREVGSLRSMLATETEARMTLEARLTELESDENESTSGEIVQVEPVSQPPASQTEVPKQKRGTVLGLFLGK